MWTRNNRTCTEAPSNEPKTAIFSLLSYNQFTVNFIAHKETKSKSKAFMEVEWEKSARLVLNEWKYHWLILYFVQVNPFKWCIERDNYLCTSCAPIRHTHARNVHVHRYTKPKNNKHMVVSNKTKIKFDANELSRHKHIAKRTHSIGWRPKEKEDTANYCSRYIMPFPFRHFTQTSVGLSESCRCGGRFARNTQPLHILRLHRWAKWLASNPLSVYLLCAVHCIHVCRFALYRIKSICFDRFVSVLSMPQLYSVRSMEMPQPLNSIASLSQRLPREYFTQFQSAASHECRTIAVVSERKRHAHAICACVCARVCMCVYLCAQLVSTHSTERVN